MLTVAGEGAVEGTPFGRYRLVELLGRGGMGEVWRAYDTATNNRTVAIKLLPLHLASDRMFVHRFRREADAAARLSNPHVIPIHTYGEIDGRLYVDMRLVEGRDLQEVLAGGPLEPERAVRIIEQVAKALHAAHRIGLVHRDVKPSNILLDEDDFAYLIDFGIARGADETGLTGTGAMIGSWHYMAPERLRAHEADARADIYALACVLYECLSGSRPFPGDTLESQVAAHLTDPPPQPSTTQPNVPAQFDPVVAKGMAKDPDNRYATTVELADAARDAITKPASVSVDTGAAAVEPTLVGDRQPTQLASAIPDPPQQPRPSRELNRPLLKRRRILVIGAAAVVVVAMASVVAYLVMARTSESPQQGAPPSSQQAAAPSSQRVSAPPAAQAPVRLADYVTDDAGVLSESGRAAVTSAIDKLYADRQIRLWVVYVGNFAGLSAENWAKRTYSTSDLSGYDSLLAVSITDRAYAFLVPSIVPGVSQSQVDDLRRNQMEPALRNGDWSGAAVAAADGLDSPPG
jgi:serine/threonine protein kinase